MANINNTDMNYLFILNCGCTAFLQPNKADDYKSVAVFAGAKEKPTLYYHIIHIIFRKYDKKLLISPKCYKVLQKNTNDSTMWL